MLVPDELDGGAIVDRRLGASVPCWAEVDLATFQKLRRLSAARPPDVDHILDGVELLIGPVEVERVKLVERHPVGQQCLFDGVERVLAHRPPAGKLLRVEEIGPGLRRLLALALESIGPIRQNDPENVAAGEVVVLVLRRRGVEKRRLHVERLEIALVA